MDGALGEVLDDAVLCQRHISDRGIVGKDRDDQLSMTGISNAACLACTQFEQRATLLVAAVEHGDIMCGSHEVRRHRRTHAAQADESNLHLLKLLGPRSRSGQNDLALSVRQGKLAIRAKKGGRGPACAGPDHHSLVGSPYPAVHSWQSSSKSNDRRKTVVMYRRTAILVAATVVGVPIAGAVAQNGPGGTAAARHAGFDIEAHRGGRALRPENTLQSFANALLMGVDTLELDMGVTRTAWSLSRTSAVSIRILRALPTAATCPRPA